MNDSSGLLCCGVWPVSMTQDMQYGNQRQGELTATLAHVAKGHTVWDGERVLLKLEGLTFQCCWRPRDWNIRREVHQRSCSNWKFQVCSHRGGREQKKEGIGAKCLKLLHRQAFLFKANARNCFQRHGAPQRRAGNRNGQKAVLFPAIFLSYETNTDKLIRQKTRSSGWWQMCPAHLWDVMTFLSLIQSPYLCVCDSPTGPSDTSGTMFSLYQVTNWI